ncbi:hypothetical protein VTH06DRAFT_8642 [Thermothelomyces fergusii]
MLFFSFLFKACLITYVIHLRRQEESKRYPRGRAKKNGAQTRIKKHQGEGQTERIYTIGGYVGGIRRNRVKNNLPLPEPPKRSAPSHPDRHPIPGTPP